MKGLVRRTSPHLNERERRQLQAAMMASQQMFASGKGDLGRTDIVQHQINTGDHPPIEQRVRPRQKEGRDDTVLYRLPTTKPGHQGGRLPAPAHRGQPEHLGRCTVVL